MKTNLQRADQVLVPYSLIKIATRDVEVPIIDSVPIGDYSTLRISAIPNLNSSAAGADATSAVAILVRFLEPISYQGTPAVSVVGGGRDLCVGAIDIGGTVIASSLDVRLPITSPFVSISYASAANQTNISGFYLTATLSTEPMFNYPSISNIGYYYDNLTLVGGDSILGANYARNGLNLAAFAAFKFIEFAQQTIGKMTIHAETVTTSGAAFATNDVVLQVVNKAWDDNAGATDQLIWNLDRTTHVQQMGIPLTGFRQALFVQNTVAGVNRGINVKISAYPEFS